MAVSPCSEHGLSSNEVARITSHRIVLAFLFLSLFLSLFL